MTQSDLQEIKLTHIEGHDQIDMDTLEPYQVPAMLLIGFDDQDDKAETVDVWNVEGSIYTLKDGTPVCQGCVQLSTANDGSWGDPNNSGFKLMPGNIIHGLWYYRGDQWVEVHRYTTDKEGTEITNAKL